MTIAYHFGSDDDAEDSADALERPYGSGSSLRSGTPYSDYLDDVEVTADGPVVLVDVQVAGGQLRIPYPDADHRGAHLRLPLPHS